MPKEQTVDGFIEKLEKKFYDEYDDLYAYDGVLECEAVLQAFDDFVEQHPDIIAAFNCRRNDYIVSDREVVAFMIAWTALKAELPSL